MQVWFLSFKHAVVQPHVGLRNVLEKIIFFQRQSFLSDHDIKEHFKSKHRTESALLKIHKDILLSEMLEFLSCFRPTATFDPVNHGILLQIKALALFVSNPILDKLIESRFLQLRLLWQSQVISLFLCCTTLRSCVFRSSPSRLQTVHNSAARLPTSTRKVSPLASSSL